MGSGFTTDKIVAVGHLFSQEVNILLLHGSYIKLMNNNEEQPYSLLLIQTNWCYAISKADASEATYLRISTAVDNYEFSSFQE